VVHPVDIVEVELTQPLPCDLPSGNVRLLVRLGGRPIGFFAPSVAMSGLRDDARRTLTEHVREAIPPGLLGAEESVPRAGFDATSVVWPQPPTALSISVVVTTCEASRGLLRTLDGLRRQSHEPQQLIVVDNRPGTSGVAAQLRQEGLDDVILVEEARKGLSRARNAGLAVVDSDLVAFTDDDVVVDPRWTEALLSGFVDDQVGCVTGLVLPLELRTQAQQWMEEFGGYSKGFLRRRFDLAGHRADGPLYPYAAGVFGTGANAAFRTRTLRELGGFDEHLGTGRPSRGGEDLDIYLSVIQSGRAIVYEPGALIRHRHHADFADLRKQVHGYGVGLAAMLAKRIATSKHERREISRRVAAGAAYALSPRSGKNRTKSTTYPASLTVLELFGMVYGPYAYWRSRRTG